MDKKQILTIGGVVAIVTGSIALYLGGASVTAVTELVGGVFVLAGLVAIFFPKKS